MAYEVFVFKPNHAKGFVPQKMQEDEWEWFQNLSEVGYDDWLQDRRGTMTLEMDGEVVAIMGIIPLPHGGGYVWTFFSENMKASKFLAANRCVKGTLEGLKSLGYSWVNFAVRNDFTQGKRWAKMLGFSETETQDDILGDGTMYTYWQKVL